MNRKLLLPLLLCLCLFFKIDIRASVSDTSRMLKGYDLDRYYALIDEYVSDKDYEAALSVCDTIIRYRACDAAMYNRLAGIYLRSAKWDQAASSCEKALALDSNSMVAWQSYFWASSRVGRFGESKNIYDHMARLEPGFDGNGDMLHIAKERMGLSLWSRAGTALLILSLLLIFFLFYYKAVLRRADSGDLSLPFMVVIPAFVSCILYFLFFHFSALIWQGNAHYPIYDYNPYAMRDYTFEHDGMEGFALYALFFAAICLSVVLMFVLKRLSVGLRVLALVIAAAVSFFYFATISFYPPYEALTFVLPMVILYSALFVLALWGANTLLLHRPRIAAVAVVLLLLPVCFLACDWLSMYDYGYILAPSLRLLHGERIRDIYFQYDVYLSYLTLPWLKMNWDLHRIYIIAEVGYYLLFVGLFFFARSFFSNKRLPLLLLAFAILLRYYASMGPNALLQVTPWRLDLWLLLLWLVYRYGAYHWLVACFTGLLLIFHRNFGFIYLGAYLELLLVLFVIDISGLRSVSGLPAIIFRHLKLSVMNVAIIALAFVCSYLILGGVVPASALAYRKIGIGMMPISRLSFYWYVPVLLGAIVLLLVRDHKRLSQQYLTAGIFLVLLAVGNSLYFFGRSHEHNVINLSAILSLCLFFFLDLLYAGRAGGPAVSAQEKWRMRLYHTLPYLFIIVACLYYSRSIGPKINAQKESLATNRWDMPISFYFDFETLKQLTDSSSKVYFLEFDHDFMLYYFGHYKPMGYFCPADAWVLKKDMAAMMQNLLDSGYYIVPTSDPLYTDELLQLLDFNSYKTKKGYAVYYKVPHKSLLSDSGSMVHRAFAGRLPERGIEVPALDLKRDFTVQCIVMPDTAPQRPQAILLYDLTRTFGYHGLAMFCSDTARSEYVFTYGKETQWCSSVPFMLSPGAVSYVAITVGDSTLSVFINGKEVSKSPYHGDFANSNKPLMIGNTRMRDSGFQGMIYELQINASKLSAGDIMQNYLKIEQASPSETSR